MILGGNFRFDVYSALRGSLGSNLNKEVANRNVESKYYGNERCYANPETFHSAKRCLADPGPLGYYAPHFSLFLEIDFKINYYLITLIFFHLDIIKEILFSV